jgi:ribosomal protein S18 acetylase RimI-like enzyme
VTQAVTRRQVTIGDIPFLFELYSSTRAAELAQVPWTAEQKLAFVKMQFDAQQSGYGETHPDAIHEIICAGDAPAGRIYWSREPDRIHILDITVAPEQRGEGIGSRVLGELLAEADRDRKKVAIHVESFNPSRSLFERLGFQVASEDGFLLLLERSPGIGANGR